MGERPPISFRVDQELKEDWESAVDSDDEYHSLTHLIKKAVNRELSDAYTTDASRTRERPARELTEPVEGLQDRIESLEEAVTEATSMMATADTAVDTEISTAVWETLPTGPERATTAEGVAEGMAYEATEVRIALEQLAESTGTVKRREIQQVEEGEGTTTITVEGRDIEVEDTGQAFRRRNPLFWRDES